MKNIAAVLLFASALAGQEAKPGLKGDETKQVEAILKDCFASKTFDERATALAKLVPLDHPSKSDISTLSKRCFMLARQGPPVEAKGGKQKCTDPAHPGEYMISLGGGAKQGKPTGLFISLHGGGAGVGDGSQIAGLFGAPGQGMINVYPTVTEKTDSAWNSEREEQYVLSIITELKRTYAIDTNRIFLAGHSMGGYGTWSIGPRHADLFAAISPMAGGIFTNGGSGDSVQIERGITMNLKNLPIWFYNSMDDQQVSPKSSVRAAEELDELKKKYGVFDFIWKKYEDIGHGTPKDGLQPIWTWMMTKKRDPLPKRVLWHPSRTYKRQFYWIRRASGGGEVDVERDGNKFKVTGSASGLTILLNEKMVKFDQPVVVVGDEGKELFNAKVNPSLGAMAESIAAMNDPELWFSAWIQLP